MKIQRLLETIWRGRIVRRHAGAQRATIFEVRSQIPKLAQVLAHPFVILGSQRRYQILRLDGFGRQFGDETARIADVFAIRAHAPATEECIVLDPGIAIVVDEGAKFHAEFPAVSEQGGMVAGNACRPGVHVEVGVGIEFAAARIADLVDQIPVAQGEVAVLPARCAASSTMTS